jgi:MFS family permease
MTGRSTLLQRHLALGITLVGFTPAQVLPSYAQAAVEAEVGGAAASEPHGAAAIAAPPDTSPRGYLGLGWLLVAIVPVVVGAALLQPNSNSLITQHVAPHEYGSMLGISASYLSLGNIIGPLVGGVIYQLSGLTVLYVGGGLLLFGVFLFARRSVKPLATSTADPVTEGAP